jgi:CRP/FNR family transcriptional regulator, anaerobic regulatory protein
MSKNIIEHIRKYVKLSEEEAQILQTHLKLVKLKKKDYLFKEGEICKANYFIEKGCLRLFFINEKGGEQITQFAIENWWITDYQSFDSHIPSVFSLQAIEDTEVLSLNFHKQDQLYKELPQLEHYFRIVLQRAYAASQLRIKYLYDFSREELYRHFESSFPEFIQRVPQYMLASYLGFSPEYLSEIRKKKS